MSRPWVLVFVVMLIVFTSQFEWKQQFGNEIEATPTSTSSSIVSRKDQSFYKRQEVVKEKIILSQEKNIKKLNELIQSLREQLIQCRSENKIPNGTAMSLNERLNELEQQPILED